MNISGAQKISSITITILLFISFTFANIYAIRKLSHYAVQLFFYDKLLVAYQVAGMPAVNNELDRILTQDNAPREVAVAKNFKNNLANLAQPDKFIQNSVEENRIKINLYRSLRNVALGCIAVLVLLRLVIAARVKSAKQSFKSEKC
jgi:hypothetical protein